MYFPNCLFLGENCIVIIPGANALLSTKDIVDAVDSIRAASVLLCQFEVPIETTLKALMLYKGYGLSFKNISYSHISYAYTSNNYMVGSIRVPSTCAARRF